LWRRAVRRRRPRISGESRSSRAGVEVSGTRRGIRPGRPDPTPGKRKDRDIDVTEKKDIQPVSRPVGAGIAREPLDPQLFTWLADKVDEALFVTDLAGNIVYLNSSARAHWSTDDGARNLEWVTQILAPDCVEEFVQAWDEIVSGGKEEADLRCTFRTESQVAGQFQGVGKLVRCRDEEGNFLYVLGKIRDVSEIDRINRELEEEKDLLDAIIQSVGVGLVIVDRARNIFYQNENAVNRYGMPADRKCYSQFGLDRRCEECALEQIKSGAPKGICLQKGVARDGHELWVEILGTPVKDKNDQTIGIVEVIADVTERKRMEVELFQASKLAAMGQLVSGIAHEINNPLTIISGNVQLFLGRVAGLVGENRDLEQLLDEYLRTVLEETERAARIVRNLVTFARKSPAEKRPMKLNDAILKTVDLRSYELTVEGIETRLELDPNPPEVSADFNQIQQVLFNLLNNAAAVLREVDGERTIRIRSWSTEDQARVSVTDTGPGVPEIYRGRIFDPFFSTKEIGKGTGLGLSICHGILQTHGGSIWLEQEEGLGASFVFALPLRAEEKAPKEEEEGAGGPLVLDGVKNVLVLDDERDVLYVLEEGLRSENLHVYPAESGEEALQLMEKRRFDLILADIKMPKMDGREFYRRVRDVAPDLARKIIFVTGDVLSPDTRRFIDETGNGSVMKPFSLNRVREVVYEALREDDADGDKERED